MAVASPRRRAWECPACAMRRRAGAARLERNRTLGFEVLEWAQTMLVHGPGDVQGQPLVVDDELAHIVLHAYELDARGRRVVRRAFLSRPKGRAKTELAGILSAAELCGPVRCDGFDSYGRPVGRPVTGAQVVAYATEEGQAGTTYSSAAYMLAEGRAADEYALDIGLSRTYLRDGGGVMVAETSGAVSAEGGRTTFAVFDETWAWTTRQLRELHATVLRNLGKRRQAEPWSLETSAMYRPGDESVAEMLHRHVERLAAEGVVDASIYVDHRQAPAVDLDDDDDLEAALRYVYGPAAAWMDLDRIVAEIRDPQADADEARRFWLNQPQRSSDAWLDDVDAFARLADTRQLEDGAAVALGFDGSLSDDATALVACTVDRDSPPHLATLGVWEPPVGATPSERAAWVVDRDAVLACVDDAFERYAVVLAYFDPAYWQPEVARWASTYGDRVREYPTARDSRIAPATRELHTAIVTGGVSHDGSSQLVRHVANARTRATRHGVTIRKDRPGSPQKIDAAMASILAFSARTDAIAANLDRRYRRRRSGGAFHSF